MIHKKTAVEKSFEGGTSNTHGYHSNEIVPMVPPMYPPSYTYSNDNLIEINRGVLRLKIPNSI